MPPEFFASVADETGKGKNLIPSPPEKNKPVKTPSKTTQRTNRKRLSNRFLFTKKLFICL